MNKDEKVDQMITEIQTNVADVLTNRKDDYQYGRELLYSAAERLQDILDAAVVLAQETEHPRAVEVATQAANALADTAGKLMDHHIKTEKINSPQGEAKQVTTNNLNVKLTTKDLLELLSRE